MKRWLVCLLAWGITAGLVAAVFFCPADEMETESPYVLRIWMMEGQADVQAFLKQAAVLYESRTGNRVYLRAAVPEEGQQAVPPPDVRMGEGVTIACRGYGLVVPDEGRKKETPLPDAGLFLRPTVQPPGETPGPEPFPENLGCIAVPPEWQGRVQGEMPCDDPAAFLRSGAADGAILPLGEINRLEMGYRLYPGGDFFAPLCARALSEEGERFLSFLRSAEVQGLLSRYALFSYDAHVLLYGPEQEAAYRMEQARKNVPF